MERSISRIMRKTVRTVWSEDTVEKVDAFLGAHGLSSVPVVDGKGAVFGIISAGDLVRFHAAKKNAKAVRAWELCTYKPVEVGPATPEREVAQLMLKKKIHHVLVTERGVLKGVVSSLDFVEQYVLRGDPHA